MSTLSLHLRYRPVRIGWCVQTGNHAHLEAALRFTHAFAGGKFNPLIPVDQETIAEYLVDLFRVDVLFPLESTDLLMAFVKKYDYLMWPTEGDYQLFHSQWDDRPPYGAFVDVYHSAHRIWKRRTQGTIPSDLPVSLCNWDAEDPLANVFLATVGAYPAPSPAIPNYERIIDDMLSTKRLMLHTLPAGLNSHLTPSRLCAVELEHDHRPEDPGYYVGDAGKFMDIVNYWNVRATGTEVIFVDPKHRERLTPMIEAHKRWLSTLTPESFSAIGGIAIWGHPDTDAEDLSLPGRKVVRHPVDVSSGYGLNIRSSLAHWPEQPVLGSVDETGDTPTVTFSLTQKPVLSDVLQQYVGVTLSGYDHFFRDKNVTFFPPFLPELNEFYGRELFYRYDQVRADRGITGNAVSLLVATTTNDVTLRALSALDLVRSLFRRFGIHARPSRAGVITRQLISQMGGLQGCRVFKIEGVRALIARHKPDQHFDRSRACKIIGDFDEAEQRMRFEPYHDLFIAPRSTRRKLQPQDALNQLLKQRVFRVGLELHCPSCDLPFWQSLDDVKVEVVCIYCGTSFDVTMQLRDRNWVYRRSGLFGRDDQQQGGIPVAVTLQQLDTEFSPEGMLYTTCLELAPTDSGVVNACETDFAALTTGMSYERPWCPQLVIGECKSNRGQITKSDVEHLQRVADALPAKRVSVFLVFAKTGAFSHEEINLCAGAQGRWRHASFSSRRMNWSRTTSWTGTRTRAVACARQDWRGSLS